MRYLIKLKPLTPFLFGGDTTFGKLGDKDEGTYLVKSRYFPQQTAILGMIRREIMIQTSLLKRKIRGEWVDNYDKKRAKELVGFEKFDITQSKKQDFGVLKEIGAIFLMNKDNSYIKKVAVDGLKYSDGILEGYNPKEDIYDNFISLETEETLSRKDIFLEIEQTGNKKGGEENSLFKKTSLLLKDEFVFAFYMESSYKLSNSIIKLGADGSSFAMEVIETEKRLEYKDSGGYLTLLSDAYIDISLKESCDFAITNEISFENLQNKKHSSRHNRFQKSQKLYLYEKGSIFLNPTQKLIDNLNNKNLQQIGYNVYTLGETL